VKIIQSFLKNYKAGFNFKESYMRLLPEFEDNIIEFMENRVKIAWYLRKFYMGVVLKVKF
jgi:hypothetical protein